MSKRKPLHDCPDCTCGRIELSWSDRRTHVFPDDLDEIARVVVNCALDHSYDRGRGVPYGLEDKQEDTLLPVVARHLAAVDAEWRDRSVSMSPEQRETFLCDVRAALGS